MSTPQSWRAAAFLAASPFSRVTGMSASWRRVRGSCQHPASCSPDRLTSGPGGSLDAEEVGVEGLAAMVHLGGHLGVLVVEPGR